MSNNALLSVITPTFNQAKYLPETIESVLAQDYPQIEHIVIDDGSTDNTRAALAHYGNNIRIVTQPNMGETRTVNRGLAMARGAYIAIINSDDPVRPSAFSTVIDAMASGALVGYPDWDEIDADSTTLRTVRLPLYDPVAMLLKMNVAMGPGAIMSRRAYELAGPRDESMRFGADVLHWFTMALHGPFVHIPSSLATHRVHEEAASSAAKGWQFAWEYSRFAYAALSHPLTPPHLVAQRHSILATAHRKARQHCGHNGAARLYHSLMRSWYRRLSR